MIILFHSNKQIHRDIRIFFKTGFGYHVSAVFPDVHTIFRDIEACDPVVAGIESKFMARGLDSKLAYRYHDLQIVTLSQNYCETELQHLVDIADVYSTLVNKPKQKFSKQVTPLSLELTPREMEVIQLMCNGYSHQMICNALSISYETIRTHIQNIYMKLGVSRLTEAVAKAFRSGLVQ